MFFSLGMGPPTEPPTSVILKKGLLKVGWKTVGAKLARVSLSAIAHADKAEFLLL